MDAQTLKTTFLGHQTWLTEYGGSTVLVDPVLSEHFGHSAAISARVFPPRTIRLDAMPKIDAVVLSHEHSDHFTFETLAALPKTIPIYVGPLLPAALSEAIESMGFQVHRRPPSEWVAVGALEFRLFPVAMPESFWEQRVTQVYLRPRGVEGRGVFIGVDAAMSPFFVEEVRGGVTEPPRLVVVANNSQVPPAGGKSIYSNPLADVGISDKGPFVGLELLEALTQGYVADLPPCEVAIAGNGFVHVRQPFGPYTLSDNRRLAQIANRLSITPWVHGPRPGDRLVIGDGPIESETVDWVDIDAAAEEELMQRHRAFSARPTETELRPVLDGEPAERDLSSARMKRELARLGEAFAFSKLAAQAHRVHEYLGGPLGARRFVLRLLVRDGTPIQLAYDHVEARFVEDDTSVDDLLVTFPFGVEMFLVDFIGILDGRLQIWDLDGAAISSWYFGPEGSSPVTFLYAALGEQVRQDLAARLYIAALKRVSVEPKRELVERAECS